jgi:hypothetical protein
MLAACASSGPVTVEQVNSSIAAEEAKCQQQGYKRGTKDFHTCIALARNAEITKPVQDMNTMTAIGMGATAIGLLGILSDERVKTDIAWVGTARGFTLYRFRYQGTATEYVGVMAQDVRRTRADAVTEGPDGYLRVNYAALGLKFETWEAWRATH